MIVFGNPPPWPYLSGEPEGLEIDDIKGANKVVGKDTSSGQSRRKQWEWPAPGLDDTRLN
jgi:hypothetical protein